MVGKGEYCGIGKSVFAPECKKAAAYLGLSLRSPFVVNWPNTQRECLVVGNEVYYNEATWSQKAQDDLNLPVLCKGQGTTNTINSGKSSF